MLRAFHFVILAILVMAISASADPVTLSLDPPDGTVKGVPGSTVGWGFTLTNNTSDFLVVANSDFCETGQDLLVGPACSQALGAYTDFIAANATVVDPASFVTEAYDPGGSSGMGAYAMTSALLGQSDIGTINVVYDLYDANPFTSDTANFILEAEVTASAQVAATPEPSTVVFLAFALSALLFLRRRQLRDKQL